MSPRAVAPLILSGLMLPLSRAAPRPTTLPATAPATQPIRQAGTRPWRPPPHMVTSNADSAYGATQQHGQVTLVVRGINPTAGYETRLVPSRTTAGPPEFTLVQRKPAGPVAQVITPFEAVASFKSETPVKSVIVRDAAGRRHEVSVEQRQD